MTRLHGGAQDDAKRWFRAQSSQSAARKPGRPRRRALPDGCKAPYPRRRNVQKPSEGRISPGCQDQWPGPTGRRQSRSRSGRCDPQKWTKPPSNGARDRSTNGMMKRRIIAGESRMAVSSAARAPPFGKYTPWASRAHASCFPQARQEFLDPPRDLQVEVEEISSSSNIRACSAGSPAMAVKMSSP